MHSDPAGLIFRALDDLGLGKGFKRYGVLARWESIVGPGIAKRTFPVGFRGDVLVVEVKGGASWQHQLHLMRMQLLDKLNRELAPNGVSDIRIEPFGRRRRDERPLTPEKPEPPDLDSIPLDEKRLNEILSSSGLKPGDPLYKAMERYLRHSMQLSVWRSGRLDRKEDA